MIAVLGLLSTAVAGVTDAAPADLDAVYAPRRIALLIGVQEYDDPRLQGLRYAAKDARDLGEVLGDPSLGGFDVVYVVEGYHRTTAQAITEAIADATADLQRDDTFLLYASGHGTLTVDPIDGSKLFFLPSDSDIEHPKSTGIPVDWLEQVINTLPARRRVLIMDTCHNGRARSALSLATASTLQGFRGEPPAPHHMIEISESEARLFAAEYHQPAMEDPDLQNGVYTHFLIAALTDDRGTADLDGDGLVDVVEAHDYAMDRTFRYTGGAQMPRAEYRITGREKIYLSGDPSHRSSAELALLSAYDQVLRQAQLLVDGIPRGPAVGVHAIEPGVRQIEVQTLDGRTMASQRVRVEAGTTTPLEDLLLLSDAPRWVLATGAILRHGPGATYYHPAAVELELSRIQSVPSVHWLRAEGHLRASGMAGPVADAFSPDINVFAGELGLGGSLGWQRGALSVGPQLEALAPWRAYTLSDGPHSQATLAAAAGLRAIYLRPVGDRALSVRYDARVSPYRYDAQWTHIWHHGIAIGLSRH